MCALERHTNLPDASCKTRPPSTVAGRIKVLKQYFGDLPVKTLEDAAVVNRFKTESDYACKVEISTLHKVLAILRAAIRWGQAPTPPLIVSEACVARLTGPYLHASGCRSSPPSPPEAVQCNGRSCFRGAAWLLKSTIRFQRACSGSL